MDIRTFSYILLASVIVFYFIPVKNPDRTSENKDIALVVFEKPQMYTLTTQKVTKIVKANSFVKYKNRDEMFDAHMIINENNHEFISAQKVVNKNNILKLNGSVYFKQSDYLTLNTEELFYKVNDNIAYNSLPYKARYHNSNFEGTHLYLDTKNNYMKTQNIHFELDLNNKKGK
jgi:hypothetical protein